MPIMWRFLLEAMPYKEAMSFNFSRMYESLSTWLSILYVHPRTVANRTEHFRARAEPNRGGECTVRYGSVRIAHSDAHAFSSCSMVRALSSSRRWQPFAVGGTARSSSVQRHCPSMQHHRVGGTASTLLSRQHRT